MRKLREDVGYTQQQVADYLNIDRSTYAYYETGKTVPDLKTLKKLAEMFKVPFTDLLFSENNRSVFSDYSRDKAYGGFYSDGFASDGRNSWKKSTRPLNGVSSDKNFTRPISDLSEKEREMLLCYRLLSAEAQNKISSIIIEKFADKLRRKEKEKGSAYKRIMQKIDDEKRRRGVLPSE